MRAERLLDLTCIKIDREPIGPRTFALAKFLEAGGVVPSIKVQQKAHGQFFIRDGRHRVLAYKLLGRTKIMAKFGVDPLIVCSQCGKEYEAQVTTGASSEAHTPPRASDSEEA